MWVVWCVVVCGVCGFYTKMYWMKTTDAISGIAKKESVRIALLQTHGEDDGNAWNVVCGMWWCVVCGGVWWCVACVVQMIQSTPCLSRDMPTMHLSASET